MATTPFELNPELTAVVQDYGNCPTGYVSDCVFPIVPICTETFKYREFDKVQKFDVANQQVGRKSQVHEIEELESLLTTNSVVDFGLETPIPLRDLMQQSCSPCDYMEYDHKAVQAKYLVDQIMLGREIRARNVAFDAANYDVANITDLSVGANEFNANGDPLEILHQLITSAIVPFNWMAVDKRTMGFILRHPSILGNTESRGVSSVDRVANLLGLDGICVASNHLNTSAMGQAANIQPIWNDSVLLFHKATSFMTTDCPSATYGFTARMGDMVAFEYEDKDVGLRGGLRIRVGMSEKIILADAGQAHLLTNAIA